LHAGRFGDSIGIGMTGHHILLVEHDDLLRQSLREQLQAEGFAVREAADAAGGVAAAAEVTPDAVLLDAGLPDARGWQVCRDLRRGGLSVPILVLTAGPDDAARSVEAGATDCVAKPFRLGALLARLRTHLRQHERTDDAAVRIGRYTFRPAAKLMTDGRDRKIRLTDKEAAILKYLYNAHGVIGRDTLLHEVWGYGPGISTHTVETHVYRLRQKIEDDPANARILVTEPGGYRLVV
jgi:DNA-binding response OmpR family regulator